MLINSLERTGARDTVERFSIAIENLGPIMAAVLMVPSAVGLAGLGLAAGYALASGNSNSLLFEAIRYLLLAVPVLCIVGPLFLPGADRTNPVRMLLLPISRPTMYVAQVGSALGDPWVVLLLPMVLALPAGIAAGGSPWPAALALVAGTALVIAVLGIASLATSLLHLVVRDRRRGEILALVFIIVLPLVGLLPGLLQGGRSVRDAEGRRVRRPPLQHLVPAWMAQAADRGFAMVPTELYIRSVREAATNGVPSGVAALSSLAVMGVALHAIGMIVFTRVLDFPGSTSARRAGPMRGVWRRTLPLLSPGSSAVALAQLRLALRTPRGRSILLSPVLMFVVFGIFMRRNGGTLEFGPFSFESGLGLAAFASVVALISVLPIAMNQFAVDRAGLTLALLSPLSDREYLLGKAAGNMLISGLPASVCITVAALVLPGGPAALWLSLPLALLSAGLLVAPAAAVFSAIFPRAVDMNSIGRGSNAHGLAGLLGLAAYLAAAMPAAAIVLITTRWLRQPSLTPVFLIVWCAIALGIARVLLIVAERIFASRRENFAFLS
jgi:hypothetical protein